MDEAMEVETGVADEASVEYLQRWQILVSTTNWEKGRIILEWREALQSAGAAPQLYSDEAWSRRVGSVSGQHVGRLRRVYERFATVRDSFGRLSWSHFCAALDWHDAELWLEGAVQSDWSVADMRRQRWEAFGSVEADRPREQDVVAADVDEDFVPFETGEVREPVRDESEGGSDFVAETFGETQDAGSVSSSAEAPATSAEAAAIRPFEHLGELPADMQQAFEAFKLSILQHKLAGWSEVAAANVIAALDALKQLALAPADAS